MSTPDARIATTLPTHPKTKKLLRRLGFEGGWCLVRLILWAASSRTNGNLEGLSDEDIELAVDWAGEVGDFVAALSDVRFLDGTEGSRVIHDWSEHNPWAAGASERSERSTFGALVKQHGRPEAERRMPEYADRLRQAADERAGRKPKSASGSNVAVPESASGSASGSNDECPVSDTVSVSVPVSDTVSNSKRDQEHSAPPAAGAPAGKATRLTADWTLPDTFRSFVLAERPDVDPDFEAAKFRDYWIGVAGKQGTKLDWEATWRNWIRRADATPAHARRRGAGKIVAHPAVDLDPVVLDLIARAI